MLGLIVGTGAEHLAGSATTTVCNVETPYGSVTLQTGTLEGTAVALLRRHGFAGNVAPHRVNYRANVLALKELGVRTIVATAATGSLRQDWPPGTFAVPDQFLDQTSGRPSSFYESEEAVPVHIDVTEPYCPRLRGELLQAAAMTGCEAAEGATYVCVNGPRFETAAEIRMFRSWGGDLVGMTGVPEVVLAREAEMCYATVAIVTNYAAGISPMPLSHSEVLETMRSRQRDLHKLLTHLASTYVERDCACQHALDDHRRLKAQAS